MRIIITSLVALLFLINSILSIPFKQLETAFSNGNATQITQLGTSKILLSIKGEEGVYSKSQGTQVLNRFFKNHPPKSFHFDFKGKESGASSYAVGDYLSEKKYRVSIKFKKRGDHYRIESITIN